MQAADFQPNERTTSRSLRQEIRNPGLFSPFIITTLGCRSKPGAVPVAAGAEPAGTMLPLTVAIAVAGFSMPAAAQAAGFVMPALTSTAGILWRGIFSDAVGRFIPEGAWTMYECGACV